MAADRKGKITVRRIFWLTEIDRGIYILWSGVALLLGAGFAKWYLSPSCSLSRIDSNFTIFSFDSISPFEIVFRGATFFCGLVALCWGMHERCTVASFRRLGWICLILFLSFPALVYQWEPERSFDTHLVHQEMERVIGSMDLALPDQQRDWRNWQHIVIGQPPLIGAHLNYPPYGWWDFSLITLGGQGYVVENIWGVNDYFLAFVARGWIIALLGSALFLFGNYLLLENALHLLRKDLYFGLFFALFYGGILFLPGAIGEYYLYLGRDARNQGNFEQALSYWDVASSWKPNMLTSLQFRQERGRLLLRRDCQTCVDTHLANAYAEVATFQLQDALVSLQKAEAEAESDPIIRWWLGLVLTELGNEAFNRGQYSLAQDQWESAIRYVPVDPLPWYGLALVHLRLKDFAKATKYYQQLVRLQEYFGYKKLPVRGQALITESWREYRSTNWAGAHESYRKARQPDRW
jgi:tetratricopeptide (TPR) repeat protein